MRAGPCCVFPRHFLHYILQIQPLITLERPQLSLDKHPAGCLPTFHTTIRVERLLCAELAPH